MAKSTTATKSNKSTKSKKSGKVTRTTKSTKSKSTTMSRDTVDADDNLAELAEDVATPEKERRQPVERRKVQRRRQIDPTTCERDYSDEEIEFMRAMDDYKRANGRMFPTCSEILEVIRELGYARPFTADVESNDLDPVTAAAEANVMTSPASSDLASSDLSTTDVSHPVG